MKFKVGDVVITKACSCMGVARRPQNIGEERTILSVSPNGLPGFPDAIYETDKLHPNQEYWKHCWGCENCFELKRPPQREELGSWDLCPWRPERVTVSEEAEHG